MEIPSHKFEKISSPSSQDFTAANTLWPHSDRNGTEKGGSDLNSSWYERAKWKFPVTNSKKYLPHLLKTLRPQIPSGPIQIGMGPKKGVLISTRPGTREPNGNSQSQIRKNIFPIFSRLYGRKYPLAPFPRATMKSVGHRITTGPASPTEFR